MPNYTINEPLYKGDVIRYDVLEKIGEGNRGEVYKVKLQNGEIAAIKWAKNYSIDKEWEILKYLDGFIAPKPIFRGERFFVMEYINAKPLKEYVSTDEYYNVLKRALTAAYKLDLKGVFHTQLGRYYHILDDGDKVRFIDFERACFSDNPRNFMQILGYYLFRDEKFEKELLKHIADIYKTDRYKGLKMILKVFDESKN